MSPISVSPSGPPDGIAPIAATPRSSRPRRTNQSDTQKSAHYHGANRNDQPLLEPTLESIPIERPAPTPEQPQALCLDRGYDSPPMHTLAIEHGYTPHIRARGEEIKLKARTPGWRARRWVVEATHSWLNRNRGILIRWCKKDENHLALLQLAAGLIAFKKAHRALLAAAQPG